MWNYICDIAASCCIQEMKDSIFFKFQFARWNQAVKLRLHKHYTACWCCRWSPYNSGTILVHASIVMGDGVCSTQVTAHQGLIEVSVKGSNRHYVIAVTPAGLHHETLEQCRLFPSFNFLKRNSGSQRVRYTVQLNLCIASNWDKMFQIN